MIDDAAWEGTYVRPTGGILTKLWKVFDNTVFKSLKEKRVPWLAEREAEVIGELNADFSKP